MAGLTDVRRYAAAIAEQGLWSVLNLGVNLLLIRLASPIDYGTFAFWVNIAFVLSSVQNALTVCHLQVLAPGPTDQEPRLGVERTMHVATGVLLVAVTLLGLCAVGLLGAARSPFAAGSAVLFLPAFLLQQYVRALAFARGRPLTALLQTGGVLLLAGGGLWLAHDARPVSAQSVLTILGGAYGAVGVLGAAAALRGQTSGLRLDALSGFGRYVRQSGWVFLGVSSSELLSRFYAFVVAGWFGPAALAALSATQQMLRPTALLATAWSMVARSDLARRRDAGETRGFVRALLAAGAFGLLAAGAWTLTIVLGWSLVSRTIFNGKYAGERWMVLLWGAAAVLSFGQTVASSGLQALRAFKPLALANAAATIAAMAGILLMCAAIGSSGAIIGTAAGQGVELAVMVGLLVRLLGRTAKTPIPPTPALSLGRAPAG